MLRPMMEPGHRHRPFFTGTGTTTCARSRHTFWATATATVRTGPSHICTAGTFAI